jgi:hypothetical protein
MVLSRQQLSLALFSCPTDLMPILLFHILLRLVHTFLTRGNQRSMCALLIQTFGKQPIDMFACHYQNTISCYYQIQLSLQLTRPLRYFAATPN